MAFRIAIEDGPHVRLLEVRGPRTTVGSGAACRLRLASAGVSRIHAVLSHRGDSLRIEAVGRTRVRVDGTDTACAELSKGASIALGGATISVLEVTPALSSDDAERAPLPGPPSPAPTVVRRATGRNALAASAAIHAAVLAILVVALPAPPPPEPPAVITAGIAEPEMRVREEDDDPPPPPPRPDDVPEPVRPDLPVLPIPADPDIVRDRRFDPPEPDPPPVAPAPPPSAPTPPPVVVSRPEPKPAPPPIALGGAPHVPGTTFGKDGAKAANAKASELLSGDADGAAAVAAARSGAKGGAVVWVVKGDYDHAEVVLHGLGIEHTIVLKEDLERREIPAGLRVLVYNCTGKSLDGGTQARVSAWVAEGGTLLSTDWGVERLIAKGFPGTLAPLTQAGRPVMTPDETVDVRAEGEDPLLRGVPRNGQTCRWWLEDTSLPFTVEDPGARVLVASEDLRRRHGAPTVAARFAWGRGTVVHLLGHVYQREGNLRGAVLVQRIVVNLLAEALRK